MSKKIFASMLSVSVVVLLLCVLSISYVLYGYFGNIIENELRTEANLISEEVEDDSSYLNNMGAIENRITLVGADGTVLFDSKAEASDMENHGGREEILKAKNEGESIVTRYSDTLSTKTIYYAKKLSDGSVLRIAQEQSVVNLLLKGVLAPVILILIAAAVIAAVLSKTVSKKLVMPINEVDLDSSDTEEPYPELAPLITKIR
ncbi:MAG: hypothetical protein ACLSAO_03705, partial [Anaerovoracaceae bacterium]